MTPAGSRRKAILIQAAANAGVLIAWELLSRFVIPPQFLPPPSMIALAFVTTIRSGELPRQLWQTTSVLLLGFGLAIVTGMAIGIAMGMFQTLRRILDPYVNAFYAMPTVAMVPLVIIWLGLGFEAKVFLTWLVSVFPVIINAQIGVMNVPPAFIETALRSMATVPARHPAGCGSVLHRRDPIGAGPRTRRRGRGRDVHRSDRARLHDRVLWKYLPNG